MSWADLWYNEKAEPTFQLSRRENYSDIKNHSMFDRILQFEKNEIFKIFSFSPDTQRAIDAAKVAHERNIPIILVTDHLSCPIASSYSSVILKTESSENHYTIIPIIALVES
ncbi:SIS domain-containing protein, partial [Salipaludibacillus neizhouensis]